MESYIPAKCMDMCPEDEINMREKQQLLHVLEILDGTEHSKYPKADRTKMVKEFSRSAAGKTMQNSKYLRPPDVLLKTIHYLLTEVINNTTYSWNIIYDYIMDRLRSVRQDMIVQNTSRPHTITILQPIIRFYAYAGYRMCEEKINKFDPHINNTHLQECLKRLLSLYDDYDVMFKTEPENFNEFLLENRPYFEALYIIFNLGNSVAINRGLNLSKIWRTEIFQTALKISLMYKNGNYVRCCRLIKKLPPLLLCQASLHLPEIRRNCLKIMSSAFNSKVLVFPVETIKLILLYDSNDQVKRDCNYYGLEVVAGGIKFQKLNFQDDKGTVQCERLNIAEEKLKEVSLSSLMLYSCN